LPLVYADSGTDVAGWVDAGSLELLVLSTGAWLEVNSLRKQGHKEPSAAHADDHGTAAVDAPTDLTQPTPRRLSTILSFRTLLGLPVLQSQSGGGTGRRHGDGHQHRR